MLWPKVMSSASAQLSFTGGGGGSHGVHVSVPRYCEPHGTPAVVVAGTTKAAYWPGGRHGEIDVVSSQANPRTSVPGTNSVGQGRRFKPDQNTNSAVTVHSRTACVPSTVTSHQ